MKIKELTIKKYKCLKNFKLKTDSNDFFILLGENGSGKSTVIDALINIFASLTSDSVGRQTEFDYSICYECNGREIKIKKEREKRIVTIDNKAATMSVFRRTYIEHGKTKRLFNPFVPQRILYYSSSLYNEDTEKYIKNINSYYKGTVTNIIKIINSDYDNEFSTKDVQKRFFNIEPQYAQYVLFALLVDEKDEAAKLLLKKLQIKKEFVLNFYSILRETVKDYSFDTFQKTEFYRIGASLNEDIIKIFYDGLIHNSYDNNRLFFQLKPSMFKAIDKYELYSFFENIIDRVKCEGNLFFNVNEDSVPFRGFSEGEKQFISIIGLIAIFSNKDSLVLLDEPDTHLNAIWKYDYLEIIKKLSGSSVNSQTILATHDPLLINGVSKDNIFMLSKNKNNITDITIPTQDTMGMGIDGLLQSEYYRLRTSYDSEADKLFKERQDLYIKLINNSASEEEKKRLVELTYTIGSFPISNNTIDFLYDDFITEYRNSKYYLDDYLSPQEFKQRREAIKIIIEQLFERNKR